MENYHLNNDQLSGHIALLAGRLIAYEEVNPPNGKHFNPLHYIQYSLEFGPSFASLLKKIRQAATLKTLASRVIVDNDKFFDEICHNDLNITVDLTSNWDYDSFLNERFLIDFLEEGSDLHWAFAPLEENSASLDSFRLAARSLFRSYAPDEITKPGKEEYSTWISDSVTPSEGPSINRTLMRKLALEGTIESLETYDINEPMRFKRSKVPVCPANMRDTWQSYISTLFSVKRISYLLRQVCDPLPYSAMGHPEKVIRRRKMLKKDNQYLMFDYKKCGLTVNRNLLMIIAEELDALYPDKGFDEIFRFKTVQLENETVTLYPPRGVGLGNCNEGITLIQCVFGHMVKNKFGTNSIFFNDDGVFQIGDNLYRQFAWTASLLEGCGMILNLKKTFISRNTIFCEDYEILGEQQYDYSKTQLSVIPFVNCFFSATISDAKALFSSIKQGLLGKVIGVANFLPSLVQFYGFEFHKSEYLWPYELGGWSYLGDTSLNECINFIFSPQDYLESCEERSFIPLLKEWVYFLVNHEQISKKLVKRGRIPYRQFVSNPFKVGNLNSPHSEEVEGLLHSLGLQNNREKKKGLDDLYNYRGLKNAKPRIKLALAKQRYTSRRQVWREFREFNKIERPRFYPFWTDILKVLNYMKGDSNLPSFYFPPSVLVEGWKESTNLRKRGRFYIPGQGKLVRKGDFEGRNILFESITQNRFKRGSDILAGEYEILAHKDRPIFSDIDLFTPRDNIYPPDYVYLFVPNKQIATTVMYSKYKKVPFKWVERDTPKHALKAFLNPLEMLFPAFANKWRRIRREFAKTNHLELLRTFLKGLEIDGEKDCKILFPILNELLVKAIENDSHVITPYTEDNINDPYELDYIREDDRLAEKLIGERNVNDLCDEYDEYPDSFDEDPDDDFEIPSQCSEEPFDEFDELDRISFFAAVPLERY
jgi:hypothetical protein